MDSSMQQLDSELASVNSLLRDIVRESGWRRTTAIGELVVARMFGGAVDAFGEPQDASKHRSIRQLAARTDCPLKKSALAQAVAVYAVVQKEPKLRELARITPAHVAVVLSLPSEKRQEVLARADADKWSVRALARAVGSFQPTEDHGRAKPSPRKALTHYRNGLKSAQLGLRILKQQKDLPPSFIGEVAGLMRALTLALSEAGDAVRAARRPGATPIETCKEQQPQLVVAAESARTLPGQEHYAQV